MAFLFATLVVLVFCLVLLNSHKLWSVNEARRRGKLPARGRGTMFDVRHLLMEGEKDLAVQLYCEIFNALPHKAKRDVEELERSLKV